MSESHDLSDEEIQERIERLDALADGCEHCLDLRNQALDLRIILAARSVTDAV